MKIKHSWGEGVYKQHSQGHFLGPPVHGGVGLEVEGGSEVDHLHSLVGVGAGVGGQHDLLVHHLLDHPIPGAALLRPPKPVRGLPHQLGEVKLVADLV